jgi:serine phosphatase RsbU (regulator of sigma subunit)
VSFDPLLEDHLAQIGLRPDRVPTAQQYWELLDLVSGSYSRLTELHADVGGGAHEGVLTELVAATEEALTALARLARSVPPNPEAVDSARRQWASRLHDVLELAGEADAGQAIDLATALGQSFEALFEAMVTALSAEAMQGELHRELVASTHLLLPERDWLDTGFISLAAACQPVGPCGGDFWLAHRLGDRRTLVVVGDVTGHGAPSMVLAAGARAACALVSRRQAATVPDFLEAMHQAILELGRGERMMTCVVALYDATRSEVTLANAGHRLPLHVRAAGETVPILARGAPLGAGPEVDVDTMAVHVAPGDGLLLYTDGVVDTEDDAGERYTERRLRTLLAEHRGADPRIVRDRLLSELAMFRGRRPRNDDTTFVIARITSAQPVPTGGSATPVPAKRQ